MEVSRDCELCFEKGGALIEHGGCTDNPDHEKFIWMSLVSELCFEEGGGHTVNVLSSNFRADIKANG